MWFKNLMIYSFTEEMTFNNETLEASLDEGRFTPCGSQELSTFGWTAPAGRHTEALHHSGSGFILLCLKKEERILPASVIKDFVTDKVNVIEEEQARKVRKKEREEIKEEIMMELTPKAFKRSSLTYGLLAPELGYLIVDTSSAKKGDEFTAYLRKSIGSLPVKPLTVNEAPVAYFTAWLDGKMDAPDDIEIGTECELNAADDEGGIVRCSKHQLLDSDEIKTHLAAGKFVVKLGLEWQESLSFVVDNELTIKKLKFSDTLQEQAADDGSADAAAEFDAQFTLSSLEIAKFIPRLVEIFGGIATEE